MLAAAFRDAAALLNDVSSDVQEPVEHWPWVGDDENGRPMHADAPVQLMAIVERQPGMTNMASGEVIDYTHHIAFMGPVAPHGGEGRKEPIDPRDKFVLADGTTAPTARVKPALYDAETVSGFAFEVWLGVRR